MRKIWRRNMMSVFLWGHCVCRGILSSKWKRECARTSVHGWVHVCHGPPAAAPVCQHRDVPRPPAPRGWRETENRPGTKALLSSTSFSLSPSIHPSILLSILPLPIWGLIWRACGGLSSERTIEQPLLLKRGRHVCRGSHVISGLLRGTLQNSLELSKTL